MKHNDENPMPLNDLPGYLKSLQESGSHGGDCPVVNMGQIIEPKKSFPFMKAAWALLLLVAVGIGGMITYDVISTKNHTVIVDVERGEMIPQIISDSGGQVISVKQNEDSTYVVEVTTKQSKSSFLDWLRKNKQVKWAK